MTPFKPMESLRVRNTTGARARLGFCLGGLPAWSAWIGPGDSIRVPRPRADSIVASATFLDPLTQVAYTTSASIDTQPVRLVASLVCAPDTAAFQLSQEPAGRTDHIGLLNLTAMQIQVMLRFAGTPFVLAACVGAQEELAVDIGMPELCVTLDGVSSAAICIRHWTGELTIGVSDHDGRRMPDIRVDLPDTHSC